MRKNAKNRKDFWHGVLNYVVDYSLDGVRISDYFVFETFGYRYGLYLSENIYSGIFLFLNIIVAPRLSSLISIKLKRLN